MLKFDSRLARVVALQLFCTAVLVNKCGSDNDNLITPQTLKR